MKITSISLKTFFIFVLSLGLCSCSLEGILEPSSTPSESSSINSTSDQPGQDDLVESNLEDESFFEDISHIQYEDLRIIQIPQPRGFKFNIQFSLNHVLRNFIVYIPYNIPEEQESPVVFMLHGTGGSGEKFYHISGWVEESNAHQFISVFPSALTYCYFEDDNYDGLFAEEEKKVFSKWDEGKFNGVDRRECTSEEFEVLSEINRGRIQTLEIQDDVVFLDQIIIFLKSHFKVDQQRFYVSGFSNGAGMSARLSVERSSLYANFATHGGGKISVDSIASMPANMIMTVGSRDDRWLKATGSTPLEDEDDLQELPLNEELFEIPLLMGIVGGNVSKQSLDPYAYTTFENNLYGVDVYKVLFDTSVVGEKNSLSFMVIDENYHTYPNGVGHPFKMADYLWDEFNR